VTYRFDILTLFPPLFDGLRQESLIGKALEAQTIALALHNWREFATDRHSTVDDAPFGGGAGLVIKPDPLVKCLRAVVPQGSRKILLSPSGRKFTQKLAHEWAELPGITLICGRYEGFDARIEQHVDDVVSIGDFVLNGGEVAAMAVIEAVARLLPGVIGNAASLAEESFADGLLEYPQYTRPRDFEGQGVPDVLLSGDHAKIAKWRHAQRLARTEAMRPDLLKT
jgi:tRNA (guanine37-N1)-methyltransferase